MPFSNIAFRKAVNGIRKRATGFFLLAVLFLAVGFLQDAFVNYQIHKTTRLELNESADEIASEIKQFVKTGQNLLKPCRYDIIKVILFSSRPAKENPKHA